MTGSATYAARRGDAAVAGARQTCRKDIRELFESWRVDGDHRARGALVERFLPLARSLARRYARSSEPFEDLLQVASLGLLKAIDRFDVDRGAFVSYAVPTILGELRRYFRDASWAVHVPRARQEAAMRIEDARDRLTSDLGRSPTVQELAQYLELRSDEVLDALTAAQSYTAVSLDAPRSTSPEGEALPYRDAIGEIDSRYELIEADATIAAALRHLQPRERYALHLRFVEDLPQSEIAARVGVSQMQVSRLLRRSLERLRIITRAEERESSIER